MAPRSPLSPTKRGIVKSTACTDIHLFEAVPSIVRRNGLFQDLETVSVLLGSCEGLKKAVALYKALGPANGQRFLRRQATGRPDRRPVIRWADKVVGADEQGTASSYSTAPPSPKKKSAAAAGAAASAEAIRKAVASISSPTPSDLYLSSEVPDSIAADASVAVVTTTLPITKAQLPCNGSSNSSSAGGDAEPVESAAAVHCHGSPVAEHTAPADIPPSETVAGRQLSPSAVKAAQTQLNSELRNRLFALKTAADSDKSTSNAAVQDSCEPNSTECRKQQLLLAANAMRLAQLSRQLRAVKEAASLLPESASTHTVSSQPTGWPVLHTAVRSTQRANRTYVQQAGSDFARTGSSSCGSSFSSTSTSSKIVSTRAGASAATHRTAIHRGGSVGSSKNINSFSQIRSSSLPLPVTPPSTKLQYAAAAAAGSIASVAVVTGPARNIGWPHHQTAERAAARASRESICSSKSSCSSSVSSASVGWPQLKTAARFQERLDKLQQQLAQQLQLHNTARRYPSHQPHNQ